MSYFCYDHKWTSPIYSCPGCHKIETMTTGSTELSDREYHGPSGAMIIEENKRLKVVVEKLVEALEWYSSAAGGPLSIAYGGGVISEIDRALSVPAPDLVGVIKTLSELLQRVTLEEMGGEPDLFWPSPSWSWWNDQAQEALAKTREIRERIGAG